MSELKWIMFKDKVPEADKLVFSTDFKEVEINSYHYYQSNSRELLAKDYANKAWAEIPVPEVPVKKREFHKCEDLEEFYSVHENEFGLYLTRLRANGNHDSALKIYYCPFCGFSPEKDKL